MSSQTLRRWQRDKVRRLPFVKESSGSCRIALGKDKLYIVLPGGRIHDEFDYDLKTFSQVVANLNPNQPVYLGDFRIYHCGEGGYYPGQIALQSVRNTRRNSKGTNVHVGPEELLQVIHKAQQKLLC